MAYVRYDDISVHKSGGLTFTVSFWRDQAAFDAGARPLIINDFNMIGVRPESSGIPTREVGDIFELQKQDGTWVDPETLTRVEFAAITWATETVIIDIRAEIRGAAERFFRVWNSWSDEKKAGYGPKNREDFRMPDEADVHGCLTVDVKSMRGTRETRDAD